MRILLCEITKKEVMSTAKRMSYLNQFVQVIHYFFFFSNSSEPTVVIVGSNPISRDKLM